MQISSELHCFGAVIFLCLFLCDCGAHGYLTPTFGNVGQTEIQKPSVAPTVPGENLIKIAEKAIESADRAVRILSWFLGVAIAILLGAGGFLVYILRWASQFRSQIELEAEELRIDLRTKMEIYDSLLRQMPFLITPGFDDKTRALALNVLANLRIPELFPLFRDMLGPENAASIREAAVYALGLLGESASDALPRVIEASRSDNLRLRRDCTSALIRIGVLTKETEDRLDELAKDQDPVVREIAEKGLIEIRSRSR